jgi:hypothetical protein
MIPGFLACALLSLGVYWQARILEAASPWRMMYWLTGPVWLLVLGWSVYQITAFNYRMTTRRLFRARGWFRWPDQTELAEVAGVRMRRSPLEWWLGLGRVYIDRGPDRHAMVLTAIHNPEHVVVMIRREVRHVRDK